VPAADTTLGYLKLALAVGRGKLRDCWASCNSLLACGTLNASGQLDSQNLEVVAVFSTPLGNERSSAKALVSLSVQGLLFTSGIICRRRRGEARV